MAKSATAAPAATVPAVAVKPLILQVKLGLKHSGNRKAWYDAMLARNGQPIEKVMADLEVNRPSCYTDRSKKAGQPEPVKEWVRWMVKHKIIALVE